MRYIPSLNEYLEERILWLKKCGNIAISKKLEDFLNKNLEDVWNTFFETENKSLKNELYQIIKFYNFTPKYDLQF